jgi:outer membrane protein OmpA-like peptidoglycan-associated protein
MYPSISNPMNPLETYQSDAMERPILRRRLFWALIVSLLLHAGIFYWFHQTPLPNFNSSPGPRLVPRIFNVKNITIDEKLLDGSDKEAAAPTAQPQKPVIKPLDLPDEKPMAEVTEGKLVPSVPSTRDLVKPIANEKPTVEPSETQTIARVQDSAAKLMDQDLDSLKDSLLKDQPANLPHSLITLPPSSTGNSAKNDSAAMAAASGRLDNLLSHGLHSGDAPVTMPGGALFEFDKSDLRPAAIEQLRLLGELIKRSPTVTFTIEGYTDSFGDADYNKQLSQARADAVRTWLIQNMDVDPTHIKSIGYGATNYLVQPQSIDMHSQAAIDKEELFEQSNRRVEIKFKFQEPQ